MKTIEVKHRMGSNSSLLCSILPIMLLSSAQKVTHYAQYYAHIYCNYATVN